MATAASPLPTDLDLARACLLVACADQAKKKCKGSHKAKVTADKENEDPQAQEDASTKKQKAVTVTYIASYAFCFLVYDVADVFTLGGLRKTHTTSPTSSSPLLKTAQHGKLHLASTKVMWSQFQQVARSSKNTITQLR
jgi:hypothetical protein